MTRYRPTRRSRQRTTRRPGRIGSFPLVAFLLIACFGILFAGCSRVKGPNDDAMEETTFTADDVAKFQELSAESSDGEGIDGSGSGEVAMLNLNDDDGASSESTADPALIKRYEGIRSKNDSVQNEYRVINEFVNVRSQPGTGAPTVGKLLRGDAVQLVEFVNASWAKVKMAAGTEGYLSSKYIGRIVGESALPQEQKAFENLYFVDYAFVNVRSGMDAKSAKIGQIPGQAFVRPLTIDQTWAKIQFEGKDAYVSSQFLSPFKPVFLVRQEKFTLPVLVYNLDQDGMLDALLKGAQKLRQDGKKLITLRTFFDTVLLQEGQPKTLEPGNAVIAVTGLTPENVKKVSDTLYGARIPATLFLETKTIGIGGISEKTLLTLNANGFDLESAGHTGDDLRGLTNAQVRLELDQSRKLIEDVIHKTVFAVLYPQGGTNDRITQRAGDAGYLFGLTNVPEKTFGRDEFLHMPSISVSASMTPEDVAELVR